MIFCPKETAPSMFADLLKVKVIWSFRIEHIRRDRSYLEAYYFTKYKTFIASACAGNLGKTTLFWLDYTWTGFPHKCFHTGIIISALFGKNPISQIYSSILVGQSLKKIMSICIEQLYNKCLYTTLTNVSMKYLMMCKVYTDVGGIK